MTTSRDKQVSIADSPDLLIQAMLEISDLVGSTDDLDSVLLRMVQITADLMQMPIASIYLIEADGVLRKRSNVGLSEQLQQQATFTPGEGIPGWVAIHGETVALADVTKDPRYGSHPVALKEPHAYICVPLRVRGQVIGVMSARRMAVKAYTNNQCRAFETAGRMVAIVIEKHRILEEHARAQHLAGVAVSLSEIAHYVKNVIFAARIAASSLDRALDQGESPERIRTSWSTIKRANQKIHKLVDDMLNYARDKEPVPETLDLNALVSSVAEDLRYHAEKHGVHVALELDDPLPTARLDASMVYDVVMNLLCNAIDAIPEKARGHVVLRSTHLPEQNALRIEVEDNGTGIPEAVQKKVFTLFFSTKGQRGTGIGLAASRKAVEKQGGSLTFTTVEGKGTRFVVDLPLSCRSTRHDPDLVTCARGGTATKDVLRKLNVLFLCTGNSCRSQMAEGWARELKGNVIHAYSAGIETHGLNPRAVKVMAEAGVDISGQASKTVEDLKAVDFDYVITVCGHANETCPMWLQGRAKAIHVGFDDPPKLAETVETDEAKLNCYRRVRDAIRAFVDTLPEALTKESRK
jgi:arsenate reductase